MKTGKIVLAVMTMIGGLLAAPAPASAAVATKDLQYTCRFPFPTWEYPSFPRIPDQPLTLHLSLDTKPAKTGERYTWTGEAKLTMPAAYVAALREPALATDHLNHRFLQTTHVEPRASDGNNEVFFASDDMTDTPLPPSGPFDFSWPVRSSYSTMTWDSPGTVALFADHFYVEVAPFKADGTLSAPFIKVVCLPNDGQDSKIFDLQVEPACTPQTTTDPYTATGSAHLTTPDATATLTGEVVRGDKGCDIAPYVDSVTVRPATVGFSLFGTVPVSADLTFTEVGDPTGSLDSGQLTTVQQIKVPAIRVQGTKVGGGKNCRINNPTTLAMQAGEFQQGHGAHLTGTFDLGSLKGCGAYTAQLRRILAGKGNTIDLQLTH